MSYIEYRDGTQVTIGDKVIGISTGAVPEPSVFVGETGEIVGFDRGYVAVRWDADGTTSTVDSDYLRNRTKE